MIINALRQAVNRLRHKPTNAPWTIEAALLLIRRLQPALRAYGYHLALGGGVLNRGSSGHDLDLYLLPTYGEQERSLNSALEVFQMHNFPMVPRIGHPDLPTITIRDESGFTSPEMGPRFYTLYVCDPHGRRVDLFVVQDKQDEITRLVAERLLGGDV